MRIHAFVRNYPVPYKPYYDTQFADLLRVGHQLRIFAGPRLDDVTNEKVARYGLERLTTYYPVTLRDLPLRVPDMIRGLGHTAASDAHQPAPGAKRRLMAAARRLATARGAADLCLVHGLQTATLFPWLKAVHPEAIVALYYHGGDVPSLDPLEDEVARAALHSVHVVFTNTRSSREHAIQRGARADRLVVLPVGFDLDDYTCPASRRYRPDGTLRLLSAGRMSAEKGFIYALEAVHNLVSRGRDVVYSLTGEGYLRPELERYVEERGLSDRVSFLGTLTTDGVIRAMAEADVLLQPSIRVGNWMENQATAVQEALLLGAVVVTTREGGVPESIPDAMQPYCVAPGDAGALESAIERLYAMPAEGLGALAKEGRAFVVENYDIRRLNLRMLQEVERVRELEGIVAT
jgi:colanic acid/amylovoran/stewartan biosynthesis glycosyltransferase WcaL/AmsK/CpsK